jgi:transposase
MDTLTLTYWQRRHLERQLRHPRRPAVPPHLGDSGGGPRGACFLRRQPLARNPQGRVPLDRARDHLPGSLRDAGRSGRPAVLEEADRNLIRELLGSRSPQDLGYFASQWTVPLLQDYLARRTGRRPSDDTVRRELQRLRYTWKRSRYALAPDPEFGGKKEAHPAANPAPAGPRRRPGGARDRPVAVPALAGRLVASGAAQRGPPQRPKRPAGGLRGHEPADGPSALPAPRASAGG